MKTKKNKKKIIIPLILLIIILLVSFSLYLFITNKNNKENKVLSINHEYKINGTDISVYNDFYIKEEENTSISFYDLNSNLLSTYTSKYTSYEVINNKYIIVTNEDNKVIIDKLSNTLKTFSNYRLIYGINNDIPYLVLDDIIYDTNLEVVYNLPEYFATKTYIDNELYNINIIKDILVLNFSDKKYSKLIDLSNNEVMYENFDSYISFNNMGINNNFITIGYDGKYKVIDAKTKKLLYDNATLEEENTLKVKDEYIYIYNDKLYANNTKISNKYIMNNKSCERGSKLLDNNNKVVIDKCMLYYEELFNDVIVGYNNEESVLYVNGTIEKGKMFTKTGDYISSYDYTGDTPKYTIYNKEGHIISNKQIYYLGNDIYEEYNSNTNEVKFLDKNLNSISNTFYISYCNSALYCAIEDKNYNKSLYKIGDKLTDDIFIDITLNDKYITAKTLFNTYIFELGYDKEIEIIINDNIEVDTPTLINDYNLSGIENKINENIDLFTKYAYIVLNNNNLKDYKKEVFDIFEVIVDHKDYLNQLSLLRKLKDLKIEYSDDLGTNVAGTYTDSNTTINLKDKEDNVLYHELMHFVDFSFNNDNYNVKLYNCNDEYVIKENYDNSCDLVLLDTNFITESGAEVYSGKYFTKEIEAYSPAPLIYEAFEYILGTEEVNKWYYKSDTYFKKVWFDIGLNNDEVEKLINALSNKTKVIYDGVDDTFYIIDNLIDLYKAKKDLDFTTDPVFTYIIRSLISYRTNFTNSKYASELTSIVNSTKDIENQFKSTFQDYYLYNNYGNIIIIDNKTYISITSYKDNRLGTLLVDYDFNTSTIVDYEYLVRT